MPKDRDRDRDRVVIDMLEGDRRAMDAIAKRLPGAVQGGEGPLARVWMRLGMLEWCRRPSKRDADAPLPEILLQLIEEAEAREEAMLAERPSLTSKLQEAGIDAVGSDKSLHKVREKLQALAQDEPTPPPAEVTEKVRRELAEEIDSTKSERRRKRI
jgi:hypothetical protein